MKTNPLLTLLALMGVTLTLAVPTALPQEGAAVRADTSGALLTPLSLGSEQITGKLSPDHLGSGTPTSATVLRGDGTWAGTTPTGATIASTGSLLLGDSTGNAAAVHDTVTLGRVTRTRLEAQVAVDSVPANLLNPTNLTGTTPNADGTITIPARTGGVDGLVVWNLNIPASDASHPLYGYAVATTDAPYGALRFRARYYSDTHDGNSTDSTLAPGAYRTQFLSAPGAAVAYQIDLFNSSSAPVTVFFPVVATQDAGLALLASHADFTPVATQPIADLDFTHFADGDRSARYQLEKSTTYVADSVNGSSANAGTLYAPKAALPSTVADGSVVGLFRGSTFRGDLPLSDLGDTQGITVQDVGRGSIKPLPIVSGLDPVDNNAVVNSGNNDGNYVYSWTPAESLTGAGYYDVFIVEINTAAEAVTPIAARRRMTEAASSTSIPVGGSYILPPGTGSGQSGSPTQYKVIFHPSDTRTPGSGAFRYEVAARWALANWGTNQGDGAMSGLQLFSGSAGFGSVSGPTGFVGDRLVFAHGTVHGAVLLGGSLQRSVFYEAGSQNAPGNPGQGIQLAWYHPQGAGLRWDTRHCLFYLNVGDRLANGLIAHTSGADSFDRGDLSDCAFLGARWSNGSLQGTGIDYVNVAAGMINRVYMQGIRYVFGGTVLPVASEVKNSVFRGVHTLFVSDNFHDNIVQTVNGGDPNDAGNRNPNLCFLTQSAASATNNLFWAHTDTATNLVGDDQMGGVYINSNLSNCGFSRNIVVLDPASTTTAPTYMTQVTNQGSLNVDYNLVINLSKAGISASGPNGGYFGWQAYLAGYPTQDQHSFYVDLSTDPRGLKAVFADPANGDFRWAQTDVARRCAAYCQANHVGPATVTSRWPVVPTVDEAVRLLTDL